MLSLHGRFEQQISHAVIASVDAAKLCFNSQSTMPVLTGVLRFRHDEQHRRSAALHSIALPSSLPPCVQFE
jgi:hypothetical protein